MKEGKKVARAAKGTMRAGKESKIWEKNSSGSFFKQYVDY